MHKYAPPLAAVQLLRIWLFRIDAAASSPYGRPGTRRILRLGVGSCSSGPYTAAASPLSHCNAAAIRFPP